MADRVSAEHRPERRAGIEPSVAPVGSSPREQRLAQLGQELNRAPAIVAQRRLAERLNRGIADRASRDGLPPQLKAGIETLSGVPMGDVRVHSNSERPAQLQARAFAQGTDIHLGPGQERHLPHEAWHVVQQKSGRVRATTQADTGTPINDDIGLEQEADRMGRQASALGGAMTGVEPRQRRMGAAMPGAGSAVVQRRITLTNGTQPDSASFRRAAARADSTRITAIMSVYDVWTSDGEDHTYGTLAALLTAIIARVRSNEQAAVMGEESSGEASRTGGLETGGQERIEVAARSSTDAEPRSTSGPRSSTTSGSTPVPRTASSQAPGRDGPRQLPRSGSRQQPTTSSTTLGGRPVEREPPTPARGSSSTQRGPAPRQSSTAGRASGRGGTPARSDRRVEPQSRASAEPLPMHATGNPPEMRGENHTRVGFEVENNWHMAFPLDRFDAVDALTNETLAECTINGVPVLEMLLDDVGRRGNATDAQVEFRTRPLEFNDIDGTLHQNLRFAITSFPRDYLGNPRELTLERPLDARQTGRQADRTPVNRPSDQGHAIVWRPTNTLRSNATLLALGRLQGSYGSLPPVFAQHASTTIEMTAYASDGLSNDQRRLLYPYAATARSQQAVVDRIDHQVRTRLHSGGYIKATTKGRNDERFTVKSPIESMLAADPSLQRPPGVGGPRGVFIGAAYQYPLGDVVETATEIQRSGAFPQIQGEHRPGGRGFRAVAEKLQAPFRDTVSGRLRLLVEHRSQEAGSLASAVNKALADDFTELNAIRGAAWAMDRARVPTPVADVTSSTTSNATTTSSTTTSSTTTAMFPPGTSGGLADVQFPILEHDAQASRDGGGLRGERIVDRGGGDGPPHIPPLPADAAVGLADMADHYDAGVDWARAQGTFSAEFGMFRANPAAALDVLVRHGLAPGIADTLANAIVAALRHNNVPPTGDYVDGERQRAIFDDVDPLRGTMLWALLRYFNATGAGPASSEGETSAQGGRDAPTRL